MKTAREKVLSTATKLFYKHGINSVGIDEIVRRSGVTKMTLYKYFHSKNDLAAAFLEQIYDQWNRWFTDRVAQLSMGVKKPEERVLVIFDALEEWFASPGFRGCPFINTAAELADRDHPARRVAVAFKQKLLESVQAALQPLSPKEKDLSVQLLLLIDGATVRAMMTGSADPARIARKAAAQLLHLKQE